MDKLCLNFRRICNNRIFFHETVRRVLATSIFILYMLFVGVAAASTFSEMVVFGDSLSDSGNVYIATDDTIPAPPYYNGRFTNGPNYADRLAADLALSAQPFLAGGTNFAIGGAKTPDFPSGLPYDYLSQVDIFKYEVQFGIIDQPNKDALYIVFIGANDLLAIIDDALADPANQSAIIQNGVADTVGNIQQGLNELRSEDAVNILVPNLPNVGRTPRYLQKGASAVGVATSATVSFNQALSSMLNSFSDINIIFFDTFSLLEEAVANPQAFGLSNVTAACYTGDDNYTGGGTVCSNPEAYLFWDNIHPTATAHLLLANQVLPTLVGPMTPLAIVSGDFDGNGRDDLAVISSDGLVFYTIDFSTWVMIPGITLSNLVVGDFNGDGRDDLAGVTSSGKIYYTTTLSSWTNIPGTLASITAGDLNHDGRDDLAGVTFSNQIYYTLNLSTWQNITGALTQLVTGDFNGDGADELAGVATDGTIFYSTNLSTWQNIPGQLRHLVSSDLDNDGYDDLAGLTSTGQVYYSVDLAVWKHIAGTLDQLVASDFNGDGSADLGGLSSNGQVFFSTNLSNWQNIPGSLVKLTAGNYNGGTHDDLAGFAATGEIYYTTNFANWIYVPATF